MPVRYWVLVNQEYRWRRLGAAMVLFGVVDQLFLWLHIRKFMPPYNTVLDVLLVGGAVGLACLYDNLISRSRTKLPA